MDEINVHVSFHVKIIQPKRYLLLFPNLMNGDGNVGELK